MVFFFKDTATTEIYTLSLLDALPICVPTRDGTGARVGRRGARAARDRLRAAPRLRARGPLAPLRLARRRRARGDLPRRLDRKSTRLNSSHANISYAVFCLKKQYHT